MQDGFKCVVSSIIWLGRRYNSSWERHADVKNAGARDTSLKISCGSISSIKKKVIVRSHSLFIKGRHVSYIHHMLYHLHRHQEQDIFIYPLIRQITPCSYFQEDLHSKSCTVDTAFTQRCQSSLRNFERWAEGSRCEHLAMGDVPCNGYTSGRD